MRASALQPLDPCFPVSHLTDHIFYQSAALPPLAAPVQTWKPKTANTNTWSMTAAAANVELGSALSVFLIQQLEQDSGSQ